MLIKSFIQYFALLEKSCGEIKNVEASKVADDAPSFPLIKGNNSHCFSLYSAVETNKQLILAAPQWPEIESPL